MEWIKVEDELPNNMREIRVWIESPYGGYERYKNAVFLAFDGNFYDAKEQIVLIDVTKWKLVDL